MDWRLASTTGLDPDRLYAVRGGWARPSPVACPAGHPLGPGQVLVGTLACLATPDGLHRTWACRSCDTVIYWPPITDKCDHNRTAWS
ncbi:hypothetical protein [Nocardia ignorata]|uniref:Uncharacterized protein n=2 Tax=Nocardia ignorata TaxID=145285 RepID=A0A4R6NYL4_NOCIG|nr:hypothetical protein [Nocardia ignorata]TDP29850.1 hypothetical protein DFR75_112119 [Nocardia ignorata]